MFMIMCYANLTADENVQSVLLNEYIFLFFQHSGFSQPILDMYMVRQWVSVRAALRSILVHRFIFLLITFQGLK